MKKSLIGLLTVAALLVTGCAAPAPSSETPSSETPSSELPSSEELSSSEEISSSEELPSSEEESSSEELPSSSEVPPSEEPAITLTIAAALVIDTQPPYTFTYIGEKIRIEDATLITILGDRAFIQQALGETVADLANMEIHVADWGDCTGTRHIVTVEGTLTDVGGHAVLADAVIVSAEASPDASTYYWPNIDRSKWAGNFNRTFHGYWFSADVQLVTVPTTVVAGTSQTFQVVFPGEDTDVENENNTYLIDVTIPAEITENEATYINEWLGGKYYVLNETTQEWDEVQGEPIAAGQFVSIFAMCDYTNYVASMVFNGSSALNTAPAEIENVFTSWEETSLVVSELIVDAEAFDYIFGEADAFSYVVDAERFGNVVYGEDQYPIFLTAYTYDADALVDYVLAALENNGWAVYDYTSEGAYIAADNYGHQIYVWLYTEGYIEFYLFGVATSVTVDSSAAALEAWELYNDLYGVNPDEPHTTSLLSVGEAAVLVENENVAEYPLALTAYLARLTDQDENTVALFGEMLLVFAAADDSTAISFANDYLGALFAAMGFVQATMPLLISYFGVEQGAVLWNPDTYEFISLEATTIGKLAAGVYLIDLIIGTINANYVDYFVELPGNGGNEGEYTAEEVVIDILSALDVDPVKNEHYFDMGGGTQFLASLTYPDFDVANLETFVNLFIENLPEYLTVVSGPVVDGDNGFAFTAVTEDGSIEVYACIYYLEGIGLCIDISVYYL